MLQRESGQNIDPGDLRKLLTIVSEHRAYWTANWQFSNSNSPDVNAKSEFEDWDQLWEASAITLNEFVSVPIDVLREECDLICLQESLKRRVRFNEENGRERKLTSIYSYLAIRLNKVGLRALANNIYTKSLYPKGTVGRAST